MDERLHSGMRMDGQSTQGTITAVVDLEGMAYFGTCQFTACMNSMNARNLLGVWARFA